MQCIIIAAAVLVLCASNAFGDQVQQWGQFSSRSRLIHTGNIRWINNWAPEDQVEIRRTFNFPEHVNDERHTPPIGAIVVTHNIGCGGDTYAELQWGGPRKRFVGLEFISAPGQCLDSTIEVYSL